MITMRMKYNNMYIVCTIDFRLSHHFPSTIPLISLHDLQNSYSTPIKTEFNTTIKRTMHLWSVQRLARELLLSASSEISTQAYGIDIFA